MLVVDKDRSKYLRTLCQALKDEGLALFCNEAFKQDAENDKIESYEEWLSKTNTNVITPEPREAYQSGRKIKIYIPRIAARARSMSQYNEEFNSNGFIWVDTLKEDNNSISFVVKKANHERYNNVLKH
jgi:hypothetical protein